MKPIRKCYARYKNLSIVAKATLWFLFCTILQKGVSFFLTPIFTRLLTTEEYGLYIVYASWIEIFTIFTTLRLNWATFNKGMSKYKNDRDSYTSTMQTITFLLTCVVFIFYLLFREQVNALTELPTAVMVAMFTVLAVSPATEFWTVRNRYEYNYRPIVFRTVFMTVISAIACVIVVVLSSESKKGYGLIYCSATVSVCFGLFFFIYNLRKSNCVFNKEYAGFALSFSLPLLLHYVSQYTLGHFDRIMIQKMVGKSAVGIYGVAYSIGSLIRLVTVNLNRAIVPWQYECLEKREYKKLDDAMFGILLVVAGISFVFSCFAPEILRLYASEEYYSGIYVIPPVSMGLYFSFLYTIFANTEFYFEKNKFSMFISLPVAGLNILLNFIGIHLFGYIAAAYTTLICYIVFSFSHYFYMKKSIMASEKIEKIFEFKRILILSIFVLIVGFAIIYLYNSYVIRYCIIAFVAIVTYCNRKKVGSLTTSLWGRKNKYH